MLSMLIDMLHLKARSLLCQLFIISSVVSHRIRRANSFTTTSLNGAVLLRIPEEGSPQEMYPPISIPDLLTKTAREHPNRVALVQEIQGKWIETTYKNYEEQVRTCAKAFLKLGLKRHESVCIIGFNSPEWFISDLAAIFAGGIAAGVYQSNSAEACLHCAVTASVNIIVLQDNEQLEKIQSIRSRIPTLKKIIQYEGEPTDKDVLSWKELMTLGRQEANFDLLRVLEDIAINECCTLVFTSGTIGNPKAVMLTHDNLTWDALAIAERLNFKKGDEVTVSYLPLSHVAAQVVDLYLTMHMAVTVYFGDKRALKGSLLNTLQKAQPTRFLAIPRVWEKIQEKILSLRESRSDLTNNIFNWSMKHGLQHHMDLIDGKSSNTWSYLAARALVFKEIKTKLGFSRCRVYTSAAAPLSTESRKFFLSIDIPILDIFGLSEASGAHTIMRLENNKLEGVGEELPGLKSKIIPATDKEDWTVDSSADTSKDCTHHHLGEICLYGRHIFMGYANEPEKTAEAFVSEGWFKSGDVGYIEESNIFIVGRLKEILITTGGENVAPVRIEQAFIKELGHYVSNCMVVGDKQKYLTMLVTLRTEVDPNSDEPTNKLTQEVINWLQKLGVRANTITEVLETGPDHRIIDELMRSVYVVNANATSNAQRIQKVAVLPADFCVSTGELGLTMKLRRMNVMKKYKYIIDRLYEEK